MNFLAAVTFSEISDATRMLSLFAPTLTCHVMQVKRLLHTVYSNQRTIKCSVQG